MPDQEASVSVSSTKWCCPPSWCIAVVTCMSDQEASVSVSSTKRCPPSRCMYQYRRRSTSAQEASVSSTKRCPPSRCISTAVVTCRSTTKHMLGRRYHSPGRTYITCWAVIPFTAAESIGHTACGMGDTLFTAVLIPMLGGYLLVDDTLASWSDMLLLRRYWYISWANTGLSLGGHHAWTAIRSAERYTIPWLVGWCYFLPGRYTPWLALHLRVIHIFLRLPGRYTNWSKLLLLGRYISCFKLFTDLKACLQISVHAFEKVYVTQGPLSSL